MAENDAPLKPDDFPVHADKNKILTTTCRRGQGRKDG